LKTVLQISFKGTAYSGWQVQPTAVSVQKTLQDAIESVLEHPIKLTGCSRTDSGVHANAYICHLDCDSGIPCERLPLAISRLLPDDISVDKAWLADDSFHSRYDATGKEYMYLIWNSHLKNVFYTDTAVKWVNHIDVDRLNAIGEGFEGTHDFSAFMAAHSKIKDTVRTVKYFRAEREGDFVRIYTAADGFLYNMVRIMVGTALQTLTGRIKQPIADIIASHDRNRAGCTMPAHGLYLNKVFYN